LLDAEADADGVLQLAPLTVHERGLIRLAWLAPDLQVAMLEGRQKPGLCLEDLRCEPIPLCWDDQRRMLGPESRQGFPVRWNCSLISPKIFPAIDRA